MDATRWMPRIGAACAALMLLVLAVPAGASAASTLGYDGTTHDITYTDPAAGSDRVRVEVDDDGNGNNWFGFHNVGGAVFVHDGTGCTNVAALVICPPEGDLLAFQLAGGNDFVDLTAPDLATLLPRPSETQGGPGDDEVLGGTRADAFFGDAGDDKLVGLDGADRFLGGEGEDTLDLSAGGP
jgi:Ca2+-binding RTX toxin-like protein